MSGSRGFSLPELLVVVTIVGILAAVAIPTYDRYIVKAHISNLLNVANTYKVKVIEDLMTGSILAATYPLNTDTISAVTVAALDSDPLQYVVEITAKMQTKDQQGIGLRTAAKGGPLILQLQGSNVGELISWTCHVAPQYNDYVPKICRNNDLIDLRSNA